jgi:hypothetical protein
MIKMNVDTITRVLNVYRRCLELDKEYEGLNITGKFEEAIRYATRYGDPDGRGEQNVTLTLEFLDPSNGILEPKHFNFWCSLRQESSGKEIYGMMMHYHNGGRGNIWDSVEIDPEKGPHWSFHS